MKSLVAFFSLCLVALIPVVVAEHNALLDSQYFPDSIPNYGVRRDKYTNEPVSRGRLHLINYNMENGEIIPPNNEAQKMKMVKYADFDKHLQCASPEPELDGNRGTWSMIKMAPPTKASIERICAYAETKCEPWVKCAEIVKAFKAGMRVGFSVFLLIIKCCTVLSHIRWL